LGDRARELRGRFEQQYAWQHWLAGEMAAQKGFVASDRILALTRTTWCQGRNPIQESKFRPMRQVPKRSLEVVHGFFMGSTILISGSS
jgi:hypothetical protein